MPLDTNPAPKMRPEFYATWETVTPESAAQGDFANHGFIRPAYGLIPLTERNRRAWKIVAGFTLRGALQALQDNAPDAPLVSIEANDSDVTRARWFSLQFDQNENGAALTLSLHIPDAATPATRARIFNLLAA